jgi:hypothetical protein
VCTHGLCASARRLLPQSCQGSRLSPPHRHAPWYCGCSESLREREREREAGPGIDGLYRGARPQPPHALSTLSYMPSASAQHSTRPHALCSLRVCVCWIPLGLSLSLMCTHTQRRCGSRVWHDKVDEAAAGGDDGRDGTTAAQGTRACMVGT